MSRIGKVPIPIPTGVDVQLAAPATVKVKGPKGALNLDYRGHVKVTREGNVLRVERFSDERQDRAFHGLYHRLIRAMLQGVTTGFRKELELVGVGYRAALDGKALVLALGFSHEVRVAAPEGITFATPKPTQIVISGADKQQLGQVAADIRGLRPPEPYKGKGIRYAGEHVRRKVGKAGVK